MRARRRSCSYRGVTHGVYEPDCTTLETDDGRVLDTRVYPRTSFAGRVGEWEWA